MEQNILDYYKNKQQALSKELNKYNSINKYIAISKLVSFILTILFLILWYFNENINIGIIFIMPVLFVLHIIFGQRYIDLYSYYSALTSFIQDEIKFLNKDYTVFRCGSEYIDYDHSYSYDLDIFEKGSIFHSINRCTTLEGEELLKDMLLNPLHSVDNIKNIQNAVKEMAQYRDISHEISSISYKSPSSLTNFIASLKEDAAPLKKSTLVLSYILVAATIISFILYGFDVLPSFVPMGFFIIQFAIASLFTKKTNDEYARLNKANKASATYLAVSSAIKNIDFKSDILCDIKKDLSGMYEKINMLQKINREFDQRNSGLYFLISNGLFLKDIFLSNKLNKWIRENKNFVPNWSKTIAKLDVINSLSSYTYNNSDFIFPEINNDIILKAENLSHPSINSLKRVGNSIEIVKTKKFFIITGANMAGKSTFIRSIGINLILASMGAPVCASKFEFHPVHIFSSMRTSDKLMDSSSYFHAELKRLKMLKEKAATGQEMLILLDEILKGTNSQDKLKGSILVLKKFITYNVAGILATHDTALGELEKEYTKNYENYYFDFTLDESGEMIFDYKLKKGVSQNMNASILINNVLEN